MNTSSPPLAGRRDLPRMRHKSVYFDAIAAIVRTIFAQPDHASAMTQLRKVAEGLRSRFARAAALLEEAAEDILAYPHPPVEHRRQLHSTNPFERLNKEIKRCQAVPESSVLMA